MRPLPLRLATPRWVDDDNFSLARHVQAHALPAPYRAYARRTLYGRVETLAAQRPVTAADLERLWQDLRDAIGLR